MPFRNAKAVAQLLVAVLSAAGLLAGLVAILVGSDSVGIAILLFLVTGFILAELGPRIYDEWKGKEDQWTVLARIAAQHGMLEYVNEESLYDINMARSKDLKWDPGLRSGGSLGAERGQRPEDGLAIGASEETSKTRPAP